MNGNFRVGEFLIEPQLNTVTGVKKTVRVEPKVMQVLAGSRSNKYSSTLRREVTDAT